MWRALYALILIGGHLLYLEIELLLRSVFSTRVGVVERSEEIFLRSSGKILYFLKLALGVQIVFRVPAQPLPSQIIVVSNHQSYFDILILRYFFGEQRIRFIAKQSLAHGFPAVSRLMRLQRHAFIERKINLFQTMRKIRRFIDALAQTALSPVIFPEGTRARDGELLPFFAAGLRQAAAGLDVPILAVLISNSYRLNEMFRLSRAPAVRVQVEVLKYIDAPAERRRCVRGIETLEQEYRVALRARQ